MSLQATVMKAAFYGHKTNDLLDHVTSTDFNENWFLTWSDEEKFRGFENKINGMWELRMMV